MIRAKGYTWVHGIPFHALWHSWLTQSDESVGRANQRVVARGSSRGYIEKHPTTHTEWNKIPCTVSCTVCVPFEWNDRLRALAVARERDEEQQASKAAKAHGTDRQRVLSLVQDFPAIWNDPRTPQRERKRMVGLLIEDVTLIKGAEITAHVRFRGGATTSLTLPLPLNAWQGRTTPPHVVAQVDALLAHHPDAQVATILNERALHTGAGGSFTPDAVRWVRTSHSLPSLAQRLQAAGWLTPMEYAAKLSVHYATVKMWLKRGLVHGRITNDASHWLLDPHQEPPPLPRPTRNHQPQLADSGQRIASAVGGAV